MMTAAVSGMASASMAMDDSDYSAPTNAARQPKRSTHDACGDTTQRRADRLVNVVILGHFGSV
jgi:hypothetical protein